MNTIKKNQAVIARGALAMALLAGFAIACGKDNQSSSTTQLGAAKKATTAVAPQSADDVVFGGVIQAPSEKSNTDLMKMSLKDRVTYNQEFEASQESYENNFSDAGKNDFVTTDKHVNKSGISSSVAIDLQKGLGLDRLSPEESKLGNDIISLLMDQPARYKNVYQMAYIRINGDIRVAGDSYELTKLKESHLARVKYIHRQIKRIMSENGGSLASLSPAKIEVMIHKSLFDKKLYEMGVAAEPTPKPSPSASPTAVKKASISADFLPLRFAP